MNEQSLRNLLAQVSTSERSIDEAVQALRVLPFEAVDGFAKIDHHRAIRRDSPEVIFCQGKTPDQTAEIFQRMAQRSPRVLGTRATADHHAAALPLVPQARFDPVSRCLWVDREPHEMSRVQPLLIAAGTSDIPVAEEAAITLRLNGYECERIYDVGVAGLHRWPAHLPRLAASPLLLVVAGMEGALPSVVAGLVSAR